MFLTEKKQKTKRKKFTNVGYLTNIVLQWVNFLVFLLFDNTYLHTKTSFSSSLLICHFINLVNFGHSFTFFYSHFIILNLTTIHLVKLICPCSFNNKSSQFSTCSSYDDDDDDDDDDVVCEDDDRTKWWLFKGKKTTLKCLFYILLNCLLFSLSQ